MNKVIYFALHIQIKFNALSVFYVVQLSHTYIPNEIKMRKFITLQ